MSRGCGDGCATGGFPMWLKCNISGSNQVQVRALESEKQRTFLGQSVFHHYQDAKIVSSCPIPNKIRVAVASAKDCVGVTECIISLLPRHFPLHLPPQCHVSPANRIFILPFANVWLTTRVLRRRPLREGDAFLLGVDVKSYTHVSSSSVKSNSHSSDKK
jgi:hypothetical protein